MKNNNKYNISIIEKKNINTDVKQTNLEDIISKYIKYNSLFGNLTVIKGTICNNKGGN